MNWLIFAVLALLGSSVYNLAAIDSGKILPKDIYSKCTYLLLILLGAGIVSAIILGIIYVSKRNIINKIINKPKVSKLLLLQVFVLIFYQACLLIAFSEGSGIVQSIININIFIVLFGSVFLYNDKINTKIVVSVILGFLSIIFASYESNKLNKRGNPLNTIIKLTNNIKTGNKKDNC